MTMMMMMRLGEDMAIVWDFCQHDLGYVVCVVRERIRGRPVCGVCSEEKD